MIHALGFIALIFALHMDGLGWERGLVFTVGVCALCGKSYWDGMCWSQKIPVWCIEHRFSPKSFTLVHLSSSYKEAVAWVARQHPEHWEEEEGDVGYFAIFGLKVNNNEQVEYVHRLSYYNFNGQLLDEQPQGRK